MSHMAQPTPGNTGFSGIYEPVPIHLYARTINPELGRTKRQQVKNACTNCQNACKKCDDARPCQRCVKSGHEYECVSSTRKPRAKGGKRGPYRAHKTRMDRSSPDDHSPVGSATDNRAEASPEPQVVSVQAFSSDPAQAPDHTYQPGAYEQSSGHVVIPRVIELSPAYQPSSPVLPTTSAWESSITECSSMYSPHASHLHSALTSRVGPYHHAAGYPSNMMDLYYVSSVPLQPHCANQEYWMA